MKIEQFVYRSTIPAPAAEVFRWHANQGAFQRYNPPWDPVTLVEEQGGIEPGARKVIRLKMGPFSKNWVAEHTDWEPGTMFRDVQVKGPFAHWQHTHRIVPVDENHCLLEDAIEYALPMGSIGRLLGGRMTRNMLEKMFRYRHRTLQLDMSQQQKFRGTPNMNILISGATGLVGTELTSFLTTDGHTCSALTRTRKEDSDIVWDPSKGELETERLSEFDTIVHLAGEPIVGRWSEKKKARIKESRVAGTKLLCEALAALDQPPKVLVSASAIGFYGNRGDEELTEESTSGDLFLSEVCKEWEEACAPAVEKGIRVVNPRIGVVLSPKGGALTAMLTPFKLCAGGIIGSGKQWMSWLTLDEAAGILHHCLVTESLHGPVNMVSPNPVTNKEFTKTLGRVLSRPTIFPMPSFAARLMFGKMADELLLASTRVLPKKLQETGYDFRHTDLEAGLRHILGKTKEEEVQQVA